RCRSPSMRSSIPLYSAPAFISFSSSCMRDLRHCVRHPSLARPNDPRDRSPRPTRTDVMAIDLVPVWTLILGLAVFMYVLLDGFDLGVGILFPFAPDDASRNLMMDSVAPIWDGNETWLILGGIGLFAAFPLAFAVIIPASYFPILVMLLGLIFRGVAFEFRMKAHRSRFLWDHAFFCGSLLATFEQGVVLGRFVLGYV